MRAKSATTEIFRAKLPFVANGSGYNVPVTTGFSCCIWGLLAIFAIASLLKFGIKLL